ncbi:60 kDa SS-A/Ro ribonucleoprotein [Deinococcus metalli]|uniref:60 kDa SS-A/Ro ribonucleoprotein n=1 Tax=Deinococcus metalli TaxID=1141878 RepID=A0A7W8KH95_9DEIO|nr:RNA-binding protein Rsr [Deinococcus metalli]MBB5377123.1 60 kDa SS-A/Ro ribonucleoprotein [Deinococcus metalli]GHF48830.1 60 kDa SS-A/Ro ribonucleoprotein [Deinococcus metalli]
MKNYLNAVNPLKRTQTERLGPRQVVNNAGGFVYALPDEARLTRFLILGTDGGTFYATERAHTLQATEFVKTFVLLDAGAALRVTLDVIRAGRAPKPDPALLVLALIAKTAPDAAHRKAAWDALPEVARTGTMLLHFLAFADALGGWGRLTRRGVANVYESADAARLALWAVKYKSRDGWSQADALRLSHPRTDDPERNAILKFMVDGVLDGVGDISAPALRVIEGHLLAQRVTTDKDAATLMRGYGLPIEAIPTHLRGEAVYRAAMQTNGLTWQLRNLGNLGRVGVLSAANRDVVREVVDRVTNPDALKRGRIHPLDALKAHLVYAQGRGVKGKGEWVPVPQVVDALQDAFYLAFGAVRPAGKRFLLGLDVSGSMGVGLVGGVPGLSPLKATAAMALVTARTEPEYAAVAFSSAGSGYGGRWGGGTPGLTPLTITPRQRLDDVMAAMQKIPMGGTDCALPMLWAAKNKVLVDTFVVYTDNETWAGGVHPTVALDQYRQKMGVDARVIVVGMTATEFTIADPNRGDMLDVVGFDTAAPGVMTDFARGEL